MNMISIWLILLAIFLVIEFVQMELYGACLAVGVVAGLVSSIFDLNIFIQIGIALAVSVLLIIYVRPIGFKYIHKMKKDSRIQMLVGADAIVVRAIDNSKGLGMVTINGKAWAAKSHRPNAVIPVGSVVKVVAMNKDTAIVDDKKRNSQSF